MSWLVYFLPGFLVSVVFLSTSGAQSAPPTANSSRTLKDKIVFVRADLSIGVSSMRTITVAESSAGAIGD